MQQAIRAAGMRYLFFMVVLPLSHQVLNQKFALQQAAWVVRDTAQPLLLCNLLFGLASGGWLCAGSVCFIAHSRAIFSIGCGPGEARFGIAPGLFGIIFCLGLLLACPDCAALFSGDCACWPFTSFPACFPSWGFPCRAWSF